MMAEISNLHRLNHDTGHRQPPPLTRRPDSNPQEESEQRGEENYHQPNPFVFDFDSFSPPNNSSSPYLFDDYTTSFRFGFDLDDEADNPGCEYEDPSCVFYGDEEDDEQMNFVTDLFESREALVTEDPLWEFGSPTVGDASLEFGFGPGLGANLGLRVVDMDSMSDSEEFEVNSGFINNEDEENSDGFGAGNSISSFHVSENLREDFEWEEVSERVQFDERENLNSVIHGIEEISVSSDISSSEEDNSRLGDDDEEVRNTDWEVLLAVHNLELDQTNGTDYPRINLPEDYILAMEYDALFGQLVENENALKGSPPAAKSVVESLPSVVLTKEEMGEDHNSTVVCAVCKDEVAIGEKMTRMPCCHLYHEDCIIPWLKIRNTCPVCRHELPTDDADYESRKSERGGGGSVPGLINDFEFYKMMHRMRQTCVKRNFHKMPLSLIP